ncbi:MAG: MFS transporter [Actinobacteria bacterium]|nr:MFS transporter [Actinomycetota bacterium]
MDGSPANNYKIIAMVGALLAMLLSALDQTIVATALPQIVREFNGLEHMSWVYASYLIASTVAIPVYGKLSDIYGRRGFFLGGIVIFLAGSVLSGLSQSMLQLILFRGLQGIGAGAIMVNSIALIGDLFTPAERGRWQGLIGGVYGIASIAGPLMGGWLTDNISWRWIFYINLPLGALALIVIATTLPRIRPEKMERSIDYWGAVSLAAALVTLLLGFVWGGSEYPWISPQIIGLFAATGVFLLLFMIVEERVPSPILPLGLFKHRALSISSTATFLISFAMFGAVAFLPLYAQSVVGFSATNSGLALTPLMLGAVFSSAIAGQIISRRGTYKSMAIGGMALSALGIYLFSHISVDTSEVTMVEYMVLLGLGIGVSFPIYTIVVQSAFDRNKLGVVTATIQMFRSIGSAVGIAVMGSLLNNGLAGKLANIASNPFVRSVKRISPAAPLTNISADTLQSFLAGEGGQKLRSVVAAAPVTQRTQLEQGLLHFIQTLKEALAGSIANVFFVTMFLVLAATVSTLFLPVINLHPLKKRPLPEEVGVELEAELALAEPEDEPEL